MSIENTFNAIELQAQKIYNAVCHKERPREEITEPNVDNLRLAIIKMLTELILTITKGKS